MRVVLERDELFSLDGDCRGLRIHCRRGSVWVTQHRDTRDHVLAPGRTFTVAARGRLVLWASSDVLLDLQLPRAQRTTVRWLPASSWAEAR